METYKVEPDRLCTMHYDTGLYSAGCEETIVVDEGYSEALPEWFSKTILSSFLTQKTN